MTKPTELERLPPSGEPTKLPALPAPELTGEFLAKVKEILETILGRRGQSKWDKVVTFRDLHALSRGGTYSFGNGLVGEWGNAADGSMPGGGGQHGNSGAQSALERKLAARLRDIEDIADFPDEIRAQLAASLTELARQRQADVRVLERKIQTSDISVASRLSEVTASLDQAAAGVRNLDAAHASRTDALAMKVTSLRAETAANSAAIQEEAVARTSEDAALAQQITTAQSSLQDNIAAVEQTLQTNISAVDGKVTDIGALYTAKVNVNGLIGGFGIYNDGRTVEAGFDVDAFWIGKTQANKRKPFIIIDGVTYIDDAAINKLTFSKLRDEGGNFIVENGKVKASYLQVQSAASPNYSPGAQGWSLNADGSAEFSNVTARGSVKGGDIAGWAWPAPGKNGYYLGPEGLIIGNVNDGKWFQVYRDGNIYAPGFSVTNGVLSITQANVIDTLQLRDEAVIIPRFSAIDSSPPLGDAWVTHLFGDSVQLPAHATSRLLVIYSFAPNVPFADGSGQSTVDARIFRVNMDTGGILLVHETLGAYTTISGSFSDSPGPGTWGYHIQFRSQIRYTTVAMARCTVLTLGVKR